MDFSGTNFTVQQMNAAGNNSMVFSGGNYSGIANMNLLNLGGKELSWSKFDNTNITPEQIAQSNGWAGNSRLSLKGTGITKQSLQAAFTAAGRGGWWYNVNNVDY